MATIGEARSPDLVGEIAPKVLERADQVLKELNDILIPQGEKNALKATKDLGDRLTTIMKDARSDDD